MIYVKKIHVRWKGCKVVESIKHYYHHRKDPVPYAGWGNNKASRRPCYRNIRTTQERKANLDFETKHLVRPKRRKMRNAWDDIPISDWNHNCWKKCTKKKRQWM